MTLGEIGFVISVVLAGITVWEKFFRRSKFEAKFDWVASKGPVILTFVIMNTGHKKDGVREIRLATDEDDEAIGGWMPLKAVWEKLPMMLDVDEVSERFLITVDPDSTDRGTQALLDEKVTKLIIENTRGRRTVLPVPQLRRIQPLGPL